MKRIIICESGATKADWRVIENGQQTVREITDGTNVSTMKIETIETIIRNVAAKLPSPISFVTIAL